MPLYHTPTLEKRDSRLRTYNTSSKRRIVRAASSLLWRSGVTKAELGSFEKLFRRPAACQVTYGRCPAPIWSNPRHLQLHATRTAMSGLYSSVDSGHGSLCRWAPCTRLETEECMHVFIQEPPPLSRASFRNFRLASGGPSDSQSQCDSIRIQLCSACVTSITPL